MPSRTVVRDAAAEILDGIDGLRGHPRAPRTVVPPAAVVTEVDADYDTTFGRGADTYTLIVRLLVGGDMRAAQIRLDELADEVKGSFEADPTLGGVAHTSRVTRVRGDSEGEVDVGQQTFYVIDVEIEVIA